MFAFISRLRLMGSEPSQDDAADDTSSLNRSLNLPWPVTESSARRPRAGSVGNTAPRTQPLGQFPPPQTMTISYPIPRTTPNTLTGLDEHSGSYAASPGHSSGAGNGATTRPNRAVPPQATPSRSAWYELEKPRRLGAPPQVVRLDSNALIPESSDNENIDDTAPPNYYSTYPNTSTEALSQASNIHSGYVTAPASVVSSVAQLPPRPSRPEIPFDEDEGEGELYTSPFDSDVEDTVPVQPRSASTSALTSVPKSATMPKSRWGLKLQLHVAQSMPSLPSSAGHLLVRPQHMADQRETHPAHDIPPLEFAPHETSDSGVETDVYNHAYSYPLAQQLSPIAEQDYVSPVAESPSRATSLRFAHGGNASTGSHKISPGADSLSGAGATLLRNDSGKGSVGEKESLKTRNGSVRTGSGGSVGTTTGMVSLSRAGSASKGQANGSPSEIMRPSPVYSSPFLTRHLNRTVSQSSSKSDTQSQTTQVPSTPIQGQTQAVTPQTRYTMISHLLTSVTRSSASVNHAPNVNAVAGKEVILTPTSADTTGTATGTMYTPTSTLQGSGGQTPTSPIKQSNVAVNSSVQSPVPAITIAHTTEIMPILKIGMPKIPSLPTIGPLDLRFSQIGISDAPARDRPSKAGSALRKGIAGVERMPVIHSDEGHHNLEDDEEYEDDEYDDEYEIEVEEIDEDDECYEHESLHAESFVTAGTNDGGHDLEQEMELTTFASGEAGSEKRPPDPTGFRPDPAAAERSSNNSRTGDSFILRRWDAAGSPPSEQITTSPTTMQVGNAARWPFRAPTPSLLTALSRTPAFWTFWLGFIFPVLWLVGGWHFTRTGECPPRVSAWEWYLWRSGWNAAAFFSRLVQCCLGSRAHPSKKLKKGAGGRTSVDSTVNAQQRRRGKRRSSGAAERKARTGQVYPALPRWVAEKQSTDDGRMRLNDPKRSLRGISFGYPFVARSPGASQDSVAGGRPTRKAHTVVAVLGYPNRLFDLLYGVKLVEVRGRPESGRRMFDPWIQRCRYALCYAMLLLSVGLCVACAWLITINTRKVIDG